MTTQEIEHQFLNISLTDRVAIIQRLTKNLTKSGKAADLVNAWTYAEAYPEEIAVVILANNEANQ